MHKQSLNELKTNKWVLLDDFGEPIRYFDYAHEGAVEIKEKEYTLEELFELCGECLL